ncbi:MAG: autotransporter outer membrane beta-barrel domain-containing protein [Pseudomonas sp.]
MNTPDQRPRIALTLAAAVVLFSISPFTLAGELIPDLTLTIGPTDPVENWLLNNRATLNTLAGTNTLNITALEGATLNMQGSTVTANRSEGINLIGATANLNNTTVVSTAGFGLQVNRDFSLISGPSTANVTGGSISGVGAGILTTFQSIINLNGTKVTGASDAFLDPLINGSGILLAGANAKVTGGSIVTGETHGIILGNDSIGGATRGNNTLLIDGSTVTGTGSSAVFVSSLDPGVAVKADITIANGAQLNGGNGLALEVGEESTAKVMVDNSRLNGGILVDDTSSANVTLQNGSSLSGNVTNVADLTLNNGSSLSGNLTRSTNLTVSNNSSISGNVSDVENFDLTNNSSFSGNLSNITNLNLDNSLLTFNGGEGVTNLSMNAGTVKLGDTGTTFETLTVSTLSGNGRFVMDSDLAAHQSDLINVTGHATGNYDLLIKNTGADPLTGDKDQQVVHTGAGSDAAFGVIGGQVDLGTFAYTLEQRGTDWFLVQKLDDSGNPVITPGTESVIDLFSAAPTVWYGELSTLRSRMGELRYGQSAGGGWMRAYGNKYNTSAGGGSSYSQTQQGISFSADGAIPNVSGQWLVGVLGGYSKSDLDIASGTTGTVHSTYIGAYTTWLSEEGYYIDAIIKANHFKNKSTVSMSDGARSNGDYNNNGIGGSIEAGKHIKLSDDWFVEPYAQFSALWVDGQSYSLDNDMKASSNKADSYLGKVGTTVGRNFPLEKGGFVQPYVKLAVAHEFANSNKVKVNSTTFSNDLSGSRGEIGAGIAAQLTDKWQVHGDVDYSNGEHIEQPWGVNLGLRYSW